MLGATRAGAVNRDGVAWVTKRVLVALGSPDGWEATREWIEKRCERGI